MDRIKKKQMAKTHSPGYAIERYVKDPNKKKKKKTEESSSRALVPLSKEKQLTKFEKLARAAKDVGSTFGIKKSEIIQAVEDGNIDHAILQFQRQAYSTIVNLIEFAEAEYKKGGREHQAYVLNALISQGRELAADLMASGDRATLSQAIAREVLEPTFKSILQQYMQEQIQLKAILSDKIKPQYVADASKEIDASLKRVAGIMTQMYHSTCVQINKRLIGD